MTSSYVNWLKVYNRFLEQMSITFVSRFSSDNLLEILDISTLLLLLYCFIFACCFSSSVARDMDRVLILDTTISLLLSFLLSVVKLFLDIDSSDCISLCYYALVQFSNLVYLFWFSFTCIILYLILLFLLTCSICVILFNTYVRLRLTEFFGTNLRQ